MKPFAQSALRHRGGLLHFRYQLQNDRPSFHPLASVHSLFPLLHPFLAVRDANPTICEFVPAHNILEACKPGKSEKMSGCAPLNRHLCSQGCPACGQLKHQTSPSSSFVLANAYNLRAYFRCSLTHRVHLHVASITVLDLGLSGPWRSVIPLRRWRHMWARS